MKYEIADTIFDIQCNFAYTQNQCKPYIYTGDKKTECVIKITQEDIKNENVSPIQNFPDYYLESLAVERKIGNFIAENKNGTIFHCSALEYDGKGYLFTAPSGTGKSTHARLWREKFGDNVIMINDDKPIVVEEEGKFYVYGNPWNGKHHLGENRKTEIAGICRIYQAKENTIKRLEPKEMVTTMLKQLYRPSTEVATEKVFSLIDGMLKKINLFELGCTISEEAVKLSFNAMVNGEIKS